MKKIFIIKTIIRFISFLIFARVLIFVTESQYNRTNDNSIFPIYNIDTSDINSISNVRYFMYGGLALFFIIMIIFTIKDFIIQKKFKVQIKDVQLYGTDTIATVLGYYSEFEGSYDYGYILMYPIISFNDDQGNIHIVKYNTYVSSLRKYKIQSKLKIKYKHRDNYNDNGNGIFTNNTKEINLVPDISSFSLTMRAFNSKYGKSNQINEQKIELTDLDGTFDIFIYDESKENMDNRDANTIRKFSLLILIVFAFIIISWISLF